MYICDVKIVKHITKLILFLIGVFPIYLILLVGWVGIFGIPDGDIERFMNRPPGTLVWISLFLSWLVIYRIKIIDRFFKK